MSQIWKRNTSCVLKENQCCSLPYNHIFEHREISNEYYISGYFFFVKTAKQKRCLTISISSISNHYPTIVSLSEHVGKGSYAFYVIFLKKKQVFEEKKS